MRTFSCLFYLSTFLLRLQLINHTNKIVGFEYSMYALCLFVYLISWSDAFWRACSVDSYWQTEYREKLMKIFQLKRVEENTFCVYIYCRNTQYKLYIYVVCVSLSRYSFACRIEWCCENTKNNIHNIIAHTCLNIHQHACESPCSTVRSES